MRRLDIVLLALLRFRGIVAGTFGDVFVSLHPVLEIAGTGIFVLVRDRVEKIVEVLYRADLPADILGRGKIGAKGLVVYDTKESGDESVMHVRFHEITERAKGLDLEFTLLKGIVVDIVLHSVVIEV